MDKESKVILAIVWVLMALFGAIGGGTEGFLAGLLTIPAVFLLAVIWNRIARILR